MVGRVEKIYVVDSRLSGGSGEVLRGQVERGVRARVGRLARVRQPRAPRQEQPTS